MEEKWGSAAEAFWKQVVIQLSQIDKHKVQATRPTTAWSSTSHARETPPLRLSKTGSLSPCRIIQAQVRGAARW